MNNAENTAPENEDLIYDAVKDLTKDELDQTVRKNAAVKKVRSDRRTPERDPFNLFSSVTLNKTLQM